MPPKRKSNATANKSTSKKAKTTTNRIKDNGDKKCGKGGASSGGKLCFKDLIKDKGWLTCLEEELKQPYMVELEKTLNQDYKNKQIFPPQNQIFNALNLSPINDVKVVIIGQDPYHDDNQAMGLCFSVPEGIAVPPSLKNMYKELEDDIPGFKNPGHGDLTKWANRGVFLLNATLTVEAHTPNSHKDYGWQKLTNKIIQIISDKCDKVVFILWGNFAQKKGKVIDEQKHCVIKSGHPSPLSVKYFLGSKCFSKTNEALKKFGKSEIDWKL